MVLLNRMLFLLVLLCFIPKPTVAQSSYKVKAQKVNVRIQPSTSSPIAGSVSRGTIIEVKSINNGWASFKYNGNIRYVSVSYLEKVETKQRNKSESRNTTTRNNYASGSPSKTYRSRSNSQKNRRQSNALWRFDLSAMPHSGRGEYENSVLDFSLMLGGDIPLRLCNTDFTLETGLRYLNRQGCVEIGPGIVMANANYLEAPFRLAYEMPLGRNLALRMGAGPYLSYMMDEGGGIQVGLEPAVSLRYKKFSVGLQYSAPVIKGFDSKGATVAMLNLSIRFGKNGWQNIATGLNAIGTASQMFSESDMLDRSGTGGQTVNESDMSSYGRNVNGISPEAYKEMQKLHEKRTRLYSDWKYNQSLIERMKRQKLYGDTYEKLRKKNAKLHKEIKEIDSQIREIVKEEHGKRVSESTREIEREKREKEYGKEMGKAEEDSKNLYKYQMQYKRWYEDVKERIYRTLGNKDFSPSEKRKMIKDDQLIMKKYRKKYEDYVKEKLPNADNSIENWVPTDEELINCRKK